MGEYIKYKGKVVKIGTMEDMYYTSYERYAKALASHFLTQAPDSGQPGVYADPTVGFRFRFPFPDEDKLPFGAIVEPFNRSLMVTVNPTTSGLIAEEFVSAASSQLIISQQKLVAYEDNRPILALVIRHPESGNAYSIRDKAFIAELLLDIARNHIVNESNPEKKAFFNEVLSRIQNGYDPEKVAQLRNIEKKPQVKLPQKRGRGLR